MTPAGAPGHAVAPLLVRGRRPVVDGCAVCAGCGAAVVPVGPGRWAHGREPTAFLTPVDEESPELSYEQFGRRHPWAVDAAYGPVTSAADWAVARDRLVAYGAAAAAPYRERVAILAGGRAPIGGWELSAGLAQALDLPARRRELVARFAWAIPAPAALAAVADAGPLVEAGAGTGYWAALLRELGADVVATDPAAGGANSYHPDSPLWTEVAAVDGVAAVRRHPDRTLLLCWPPPEDDAASWAVLRAYRGDVLCYVGEDADGPAGTPRFHRELALNWTATDEVAIPTWPGLRDRLTVFRRNPVRRPHRVRDRCPACGRVVRTGQLGRCERCVATRPAALALRRGPHRLEYDTEQLAALPAALRIALLASRDRIEPPAVSPPAADPPPSPAPSGHRRSGAGPGRV